MESEKEKNDDIAPFYVADYFKNDSSPTAFILKGTRIPKPITRFFKDFDFLRLKLVERWPGIFIPQIHQTKKSNDDEKDTLELKSEILNRFCAKICNTKYLYSSEEIEIFLHDNNDFSNSLNTLTVQTYEELHKKYTRFFKYDDNFDSSTYKDKSIRFLQSLKSYHLKIKQMRKEIKHYKNEYLNKQKKMLEVLESFWQFEQNTIKELSNQNEEMLLFSNLNNDTFHNKFNEIVYDKVNPLEQFYYSMIEQMEDTEAMIEAIVSLDGLQDIYDTKTKEYNLTADNLINVYSNKLSLKIVFGFQSRENEINLLTTEKERLEREISSLDKVIELATFKMDKDFTMFQNKIINNYYDNLQKYQQCIKENNKIYTDLWDAILLNISGK